MNSSYLSDGSLNFSTLLQVESEALENCEEKIQSWKNQKAEYTTLKENLEKLPQELSHDVMVPFGSCAYMSGKMVHTNEILVLLGDNWFVSRSAFQAIEIVERRLQYVEKELKKLEEEKELYTKKLQFIEHFDKNQEDVVEIREPLEGDETSENCGKNDNELTPLERIQEESSSCKLETNSDSDQLETNLDSNCSSVNAIDAVEYAKLMAHLDELEKREELEDEELLNDSCDSAEESLQLESSSSSLRNKTEFQNESFQLNENELSKSLNINEIYNEYYKIPPSGVSVNSYYPAIDVILDEHVHGTTPPNVTDVQDVLDKLINEVVEQEDNNKNDDNVNHCERKFIKKVTWNESSLENLVEAIDVASPAEENPPVVQCEVKIEESVVAEEQMQEHSIASTPPMKSILKNRRESSPIDVNLIREMEERKAITILPGSTEAFTGIVCEKPVSYSVLDVTKTQQVTSEPIKRRASKFRVQRATIQ